MSLSAAKRVFELIVVMMMPVVRLCVGGDFKT